MAQAKVRRVARRTRFIRDNVFYQECPRYSGRTPVIPEQAVHILFPFQIETNGRWHRRQARSFSFLKNGSPGPSGTRERLRTSGVRSAGSSTLLNLPARRRRGLPARPGRALRVGAVSGAEDIGRVSQSGLADAGHRGQCLRRASCEQSSVARDADLQRSTLPPGA